MSVLEIEKCAVELLLGGTDSDELLVSLVHAHLDVGLLRNDGNLGLVLLLGLVHRLLRLSRFHLERGLGDCGPACRHRAHGRDEPCAGAARPGRRRDRHCTVVGSSRFCCALIGQDLTDRRLVIVSLCPVRSESTTSLAAALMKQDFIWMSYAST